MKRFSNWLIPVLVLGALGFVVLGVNQAGFSQETPVPIPTLAQPKIGVVNISAVFDNYKKVQEYSDLLERDKQKEELKIQEIGKEIENLMDEIDALNRHGALHREKMERLAMFSAQRDYRIKNWDWIKIKRDKQVAMLYNEIQEVVDQYAKEHGYVLILKSNPTPFKTVESPGDATEIIMLRMVLYHDKAIDLTDEITRILNEK